MRWDRRASGATVSAGCPLGRLDFGRARLQLGQPIERSFGRLRRPGERPEGKGAGYRERYSEASTSSMCPSTFTFGQMRSTLPSLPMSTVVRRVPVIFLPYITFSPQAP